MSDGAGEVGEPAPGLGHHHVPDGEAHLAVAGVKGVRTGRGDFLAIDEADGRVGDGGGGQAHGYPPIPELELALANVVVASTVLSNCCACKLYSG